jgi:type IV pilus assembly protein PilY1
VYAADLLGNVWRLDLTPATGNYLAPTKIAALADSSGNSQPVTTRPLIETDPNSLKRYVFIGTGQLLADSDILNNKVQTFYSITDGTNTAFDTQLTLPQGVIYPIKRANLNALTISTGTSNNLSTGLGSNPASPSGYYVDLPVSADNIAERVNQQPTANNGVVLFAGNLPDGDACTPSGTNQVFALSYATGQSRLLAPNSNGVLQVTPSLSGGNGLVTDLQFVNVNGTIQAKAGTNQRLVTDLQGNFTSAGVVKKLNWREVPLAD